MNSSFVPAAVCLIVIYRLKMLLFALLYFDNAAELPPAELTSFSILDSLLSGIATTAFVGSLWIYANIGGAAAGPGALASSPDSSLDPMEYDETEDTED